MSVTGHLLAALSYGTAAAAACLFLPFLLGVDAWTAVALGLAVLAGGGLAHEAAVRRAAERRDGRRLALLRRGYVQTREDVARARDEIRRVYETLENLSALRGDAPADALTTIKEVAAEVRVLQALVEQLHAAQDTAPPASAAQVAPGGGEDDASLADAAVPLPEAEVLEIVRNALRQDRIDLYLQPIVSLPQRKRRYYECFSRIRAEDDRVILPEQYLPVARQSGLIRAIDNMLLFRCVQLLRRTQRMDRATAVFCNIAPHTIEDREFFNEFIEYLVNCPDLAPFLVFEFAQADFANFGEGALSDLQRLAEAGYRFSIDRVSDARLDPERLGQRNVQFVKIDAALLLAPESGGLSEEEFLTLKARLDEAHIDVVVEKIETEQMLRALLDHNIDFGQGYLFGEPRLHREPAGTRRSA